MKRLLIIMACVAVYSLATGVIAFSYTLEPGPADGKDTMVLSSEPDVNYGNAEYMFAADVWDNGQHGYMYSLLQFDIPAQLLSVEIENVTLVLVVAQGILYETSATTAYRITDPWDEDQVTFNNMPSHDASNPIATAPVTLGMLVMQPIQFDVTNTFIDWQQGTSPNYGMLIKHDMSGQIDSNNLLQIFSSDAVVPDGYRPQLIITATQIPEPMSCVMLAVALVAMKSVRKRR